MNVDGTGVRRLTYLERGPAELCCHDRSPDGEWLAVLGVSAQAWGDAAGSLRSKSGHNVDGRAMYPAWSPDGERLALSFLPSGLEGEKLFQAAEVYTMRLDGRDLTRLTNNEVMDGRANWW